MGHKKSLQSKMTTGSGNPKMGAANLTVGNLRFEHSLYRCVLNSYASHRPNGHLGLRDYFFTAHGSSVNQIFILAKFEVRSQHSNLQKVQKFDFKCDIIYLYTLSKLGVSRIFLPI